MYAPFFRLQREPFSIAPDPHFLFMSEAHREALAHLLYGLAGGGGFVLLTGEIGAGKTTVCRCFLDQVPANTNVAYIFNPKLGVTELLQTVCDEFHIDRTDSSGSVKDYVDRINAFLLASHAAGRNSVLIIDEAQSLAPRVLEQLRLLTNLETAERKLLQIVLIGQPELRDLLARPELEQLAQRVIARYHLPALSERETQHYVQHRLAVAGLTGELPFDAPTLARIHRLCGGIPRKINLLAGRALLGGYASGKTHVDRAIVERAAREVFGTVPARVPSLGAWALGTLGVAVVAGALAAAWPRAARLGPMAATASAPPAAAASSAASAAAAASAPASATAAASAPSSSPTASAASVLAVSLHSDKQAWRELAALWKVDLGGRNPCEPVQHPELLCFRGISSLMQLREIGRPGLLTLRDANDTPSYVLLMALDEHQATVTAGGAARVVSTWDLGGLWRGEFATLWRAPPGYREPPTDTPPPALAAWLAEHLPGPREQPLKTRLTSFQVTQGLKPDGVAGPMTLMQINRASGLDEPRLQR